MGPFRIPALLVIGFLLAGVAVGQEASPAPASTAPQQTAGPTAQQIAQATSLLQQSLLTQTKGAPVTDVTLTGTARRIAGSD